MPHGAPIDVHGGDNGEATVKSRMAGEAKGGELRPEGVSNNRKKYRVVFKKFSFGIFGTIETT